MDIEKKALILEWTLKKALTLKWTLRKKALILE